MMFKDYEELKDDFGTYSNYCSKLELDVIGECPICHLKISPILIAEFQDKGRYNYVFLQCPDCKELFVLKYSMFYNPTKYRGYRYELKEVTPKRPKKFSFPDKVKEISPMFIEIYDQASNADANNLNQIVGIGYRKSLEFLIKDYLKYKSPEKSDEIEKKSLGKCIEMIDNINIKKMAKGATWIGNDETHYVKKWESKDISDLKKLIDLTLTWIDLELKTEEYSRDMNL